MAPRVSKSARCMISRPAGRILTASGVMLAALSVWPYGMGFASGWPSRMDSTSLTGRDGTRSEHFEWSLDIAVPQRVPELHCGEECMAAINECMSSGCSVDELILLEEKLAANEEDVEKKVAFLKQESAYDLMCLEEDALGWLERCTQRFRALRSRLVKPATSAESILARIGKALTSPFRFGFRSTNHQSATQTLAPWELSRLRSLMQA
eukprot:TRINITY_DN51477_c0_g1_i1.p1 TRINITY_DN51477_c0_g1~~TRINITY_DN51477_c0_g1_i1.p1  ORF type:complete len:220 (+),score=37.06 TRINITY_DN51477_c0_g1_i1:36-662(+)